MRKMIGRRLVLEYLLITLSTSVSGYQPAISPFFFLCNYHGNVNELGIDKGEVAISVAMSGNPDSYIPGHFYNVTITSSMSFDGFFLTGLYTLTNEAISKLQTLGFYGNSLTGQSLMCSMVHSQMSLQPQYELSFIWMAPPEGTGCVSFLATATLGQQLLFKDTTVLQICEAGAPTSSPLRPQLAVIHTDGVILRDDFESSPDFDSTLWTQINGANISRGCGTVMYGDSAVFCESHGNRELVSVPLNTTLASVLQFSVSAGTCGYAGHDDNNITISIGLSGCSVWKEIDTIRAPTTQNSEVHLVHLPTEGRGDGICIRWQQLSSLSDASLHTTTESKIPVKTTLGTVYPVEITTQPPVKNVATPVPRILKENPYFVLPNDESEKDFKSCWAIDNVVIVNMADPPSIIAENFDPVNPSNWIFFPGANIRHKCHSDESTMYFNLPNQTHNFAVTRDMDLSAKDYQDDIMLEEQFESKYQLGWRIQGGRVDVICGVLYQGNSMVFDGRGKRIACTPYIDTRTAGNLRFYFGFGSGSCHVTKSEKVKVLLYLEDKNAHTYILKELTYKDHQESKLISVPINGEQRQTKARVCWHQKFHNGVDRDVWAIDNVLVLPHFPRRSTQNINKMAQFGLNLKCGNDPKANSVNMEYSTDHGGSWYPVHKPCLPGNCYGIHQPVSSDYKMLDFQSWKRVTQPLPYVAMVPLVRFRWRQTTQNEAPNWALDNVFLGDCEDGCSGNGMCTLTGCKCDFGFEGKTCNSPVVPSPKVMVENFADDTVMTSSNFPTIKGASLNFDCDVLSSGKALVMNKGGPRRVVTTDFDTTDNKYLQFYIRVGSHSVTSKCPAPSSIAESVILDYSCNGGLKWDLIKIFDINELKDPQSDIILLPDEAKGAACRFRWWQPSHSGPGRDVWAIDGISLNNKLFNTLNMPMRDFNNETQDVAVNLGKISDSYCDGRKSMSFIEERKDGEMRYIVTKTMHIGPTYIMQFDLVMGCRIMYDMNKDNHLYLEYSTDHGLSWSLVEESCVPPKSCKKYTEGTVYKPSKYLEWTQVTISLPAATWSHATKFRIRQSDWGPTDSWAVSRLYIGQQCQDMCNGHGQCVEGVCQCDDGFNGGNCKANVPIDSKMQADFGIRYKPEKDFLHIWGGEVTNGNKGCGTLLSGETLYFFQNGVREVQTKDFDTTSSDYIQFYLRIGGDLPDCNGAETRDEGVLLQYSDDGGTTWNLLQEMIPSEYRDPKFVHVVLPKTAKSPVTKFRWWQPSHSGGGKDHWAIDEIVIGSYERLRKLDDDFEAHLDIIDSGVWSTITEGIRGKYCQAKNWALILANQQNNKFVVTKDLDIQTGDVIQFKINVGCSNQFRWDHPVLLQYSHDGGQTWKLLHEPCYQENDCNGLHTEGTIYYSGPHGYWQTVVIPVSQDIAMHPVMFRWWQQGGYAFSFALNDVYIGPPCSENCHRNGVCTKSRCDCDDGFTDYDCDFVGDSPYGMLDWFDNHHEPTDKWRRIMGGKLGLGCGVVDYGNSMYFSGQGTREAVTIPLNTTYLRMLQFVIKIGGNGEAISCTQPISRNEGIIVDYSTDNEITWHVLKMVEPRILNNTTEFVTINLPPEAKTERTIFRWWQPLGYGGMPRAEWGLDSLIIGVNETNKEGFQDDFNSMMPDPYNWLLTESAIPRITCNSKGNALEFSRDKGLRFAETQDFKIMPSTFLQFDIAMACDSLYGALYSVMLEYSVDMGQKWHPVVDKCAPPDFQCSGYHLSSDYMSDQHKNWTRVTVYLPPGAVSQATRFRWKQRSSTPRGKVWALDNVYLGNGCPWLCSGHGYCREGKCICDDGFAGDHCEPIIPLPMMFRDDFNKDNVDSNNWKEIYGGETSNVCGQIVSGKALTFHEDHLRMIVSRDIDTTMLDAVEFYFQYGCNGRHFDWPRSESVLLQYSSNGGITWNLLKEIHYTNQSGVRFFSLNLPMKAKSPATRFRFWQAENQGKMLSTWAVDNMYIGKMFMNPSMMSDSFDASSTGPLSDSWLFVNDGEVDSYCSHNTRQDTKESGKSALVFKNVPGMGERYVETKDMDVGPMSIIQFDINVGCEATPTDKYPVRLEYSATSGKTWNPLVPNCAEVSSARCFDINLPTTKFYGGTTKYWRRITVPLDNVYVCGSLRFRWYQGFVPDNDFGPEWAIDNVFIGMACMDHCLGHGACSNTMMCTCDTGHQGDSCYPANDQPNYLKEDFTAVNIVLPYGKKGPLKSFSTDDEINKNKWWIWTGGEFSHGCGTLVSGESLQFSNKGERELVSTDLDLSRVSIVQFFIRLGCTEQPPDISTFPVYLQFSTNGGITWNSIEQFEFNKDSNRPNYIALHLPEKARTNSTRVRWWQPSLDGTFQEDWAIDQIYLGGDIDGVQPLMDDPVVPRETTWLVHPGAELESVCGVDEKAIHFNGDSGLRYVMSADVIIQEGTFMQFEIAMDCTPNNECYDIGIQYSHDLGNSWKLLQPPCLPSDVDCGRFYPGSTLTSDVHTGWNRITIPLPYYSWSKTVRFRWIQPAGYGKKQPWAVKHMYIGRDCLTKCSGHGKCSDKGCVCDTNWSGFNCNNTVTPLPKYLYDTFSTGANETLWSKVVGAKVTKPCEVMAAGNALHFTEDCSRILITNDLDLRDALYVQFYFLFGCNASPTTRNQGVLLDFSKDGGITWMPLSELYYALYTSPRFITLVFPPDAKKNGVRLRWWQPLHGGRPVADWAIDNVRIGGNENNPESLTSDFSDGVNHEDWLRDDNMDTGKYCEAEDVARGTTLSEENSVLTTRDLNVKENYMLQFEINVGCGQAWNESVAPVHLQYSTDHGLTWSYFSLQCLPNDPKCNGGPHTASIYYGEPMGMWRRQTFQINDLPVSSATRFRWMQKANGVEGATNMWGIKNMYIGPPCEGHCSGHGSCYFPQCICDNGYSGSNCDFIVIPNPTILKDNFEKPEVDKTKWSLVQGGNIGKPCRTLVEGSAMVMNAPVNRQLVTVDLDLRNAKFIQYQASIGGDGIGHQCFTPSSSQHSVILEYSKDGGISWKPLHVLDFGSYTHPKRDYISLPLDARTESTRIRWWQPLADDASQDGPQWALDNLLIGGAEINPSLLQVSFDESKPQQDVPWEFNPYGEIEKKVCAKSDNSLVWKEGKGDRSFTTNQMIVQDEYMLQFKIAMGCDKHYNICSPQPPVRLEFNKNPLSDRWDLVQHWCLPDLNSLMDCQPNHYHSASVYTPDLFPTWTLVTIELSEKAFSSWTRFRWIQDAKNATGPAWALDDVYIGEKCPKMCHSRGTCRKGKCFCDKGFYGKSCTPRKSGLIRKMYDSFEGGIFKFYWSSIIGGEIGFGCGALQPYAHGKTLYFNGCGVRQAVTAEMDFSTVSKVMFVLQIGCRAQTSTCNVKTGSGSRYNGVLLQYTKNRGAEWKILARHDPEDYLNPKRAAYDVPRDAQAVGVQLRWWQPVHGGEGHDQWAIDQVEIIQKHSVHSARFRKKRHIA